MSSTSFSLESLKPVLPAERIKTDAESLLFYGRDWVKHFDPKPSAIVFPTSTEEVVALVKWARTTRIGLVPSGGRTGLSGAATALHGEVVVSFEKMNRVLNFDPIDRIVHCQPGVITESLQKFAREKGLFYPVDFAARGSSHLGGNIATNAGGVKVLRYGMTREWVAGLKVVTGRGEVLELNNGLVKNATGLDLRHLFIGSEGILGFVTEAAMRLTAPTRPLKVFILGVQDLDAIMKIYSRFRAELPITAFEFFSDLALKHVLAQGRLQAPLAARYPHYILVEVEMTESNSEEQALTLFENCVESGWIVDGVVSQNETQARDFWSLREDISEATSPYTPYKNDISVTVAQVPEFLRQVDMALTKNYPDFEVVWFGHIGDGNMHINILKPPTMAKSEFVTRCKSVDLILFEIVQSFSGSVSAEHGVGLVKKAFLQFTRSSAEVEYMRGIKSVFDPDGIMNPGKVFDIKPN